MHITDPLIEQYVAQHTTPQSEILYNLERETHLKTVYPRMLTGHVQGRFLAMISRMIKPKNILEIGTFTGYSTICLTEGLDKGGYLHTIEINEELRDLNRKYFEKAGISKKVTVHYGDALKIIPKFNIEFDLIFLDADKINYSRYYDLCKKVLVKGGFLLADNVLWSGKVIAENKGKADKDTIAVIDFNKKVQADPDTENVMIPLRDGITLIRKIC